MAGRSAALPLIEHGALTRPGPRQPIRLAEYPEWHGWGRQRNIPARVCRWIERYVKAPTGAGAGEPIRLAGFQRKIIETLYDTRAAVVSLPAGNGKTTLLAAIALERICRGDDYTEVDVVATKHEQAGFLVEAAKRMVEASPELVPLCAFSGESGTLDYRVNGSRVRAHPARLSAVQGLNFNMAIVDEIGFADDEVVNSLIARLGKRPDAAVIGIGTPGMEPNVMFRLRERQAELATVGFKYLEWAAPAGCDVTDRKAWAKANPAVRAGFLGGDALALQASILPEHEFRTYHLGQWVIGAAAGWLPPVAWEACPTVAAPPFGTEVILGLAGTWRSSVAVVGCTLDGALFTAWVGETASDEELLEVFGRAAEEWRVVEIVVAPRQRANLIPLLAENGLAVEQWPHRLDIEVSSATEWRRAILEGRVAHDHHPALAAHVGASVARSTSDGSLHLVPPDDGRPVDACRAARMAWWRATMPEYAAPAIY